MRIVSRSVLKEGGKKTTVLRTRTYDFSGALECAKLRLIPVHCKYINFVHLR
jgi:hypothetical protein